MEGEIIKQIRVSKEFLIDIERVYQYGLETFGMVQAKRYEEEIWGLIEALPSRWNMFPECRHLRTKSKKYRWIILESHTLIYRVMRDEVQVLRIIHARRSIRNVIQSRRVRL